MTRINKYIHKKVYTQTYKHRWTHKHTYKLCDRISKTLYSMGWKYKYLLFSFKHMEWHNQVIAVMVLILSLGDTKLY